ncbi:TLD-domain-containing protein [Mrakia frigida]|uniref:Oxr1p n=1 Tax=Mrakia frigida TaxID=29902 RepID=UPI003FCC2017
MGLPEPLIPTRKSPAPHLDILTSSGSSSPSSVFPPNLKISPSTSPSASTGPTASSSTSHSRFPSISSSSEDEFGSFVSVPEGHDPLETSNDLLSFSPTEELGQKVRGLTLLEDAKRREESRREGVLAELLNQEEGELFGRPSRSTNSPGSTATGSRPIIHHRRQSSSAGSPTRPILSPPRRLSHIMSPSSQSSTLEPNSFSGYTTQEPSSLLSSSTADIFHADTPRHDNAEDFFSPLVRKVSLEPRGSPYSDPSLHNHRSLFHHHNSNNNSEKGNPVAKSLRPSFPHFGSSSRSSSSSTPTPPRPSSTPPHPTRTTSSSKNPTPSPPPTSSSNKSTKSATLPNLLKAGSRWTSLVSNSLPISNTPAALTHTNPFRGSGSHSSSGPGEVYIPPTGAPGFRPEKEGWNTGGWELPKEGAREDEVKLVGRTDVTLGVLTSSSAEMIRPHLPPRQRLESKWTLLYSLDQHGSSLTTLYYLCNKFAEKRPESGNVIVVKDSEGGLFGAYVNEAFRVKPGSYYGSGECFLFKFHPFPNSQPSPSNSNSQHTPASTSTPASGGFELYRWTGKNDYFILCESSFLSVGGGDGKFGLYLDSSLYAGSSARCPAFENDVLCAVGEGTRKGRFECVGVEVWGMGG